MIWINCGYCFAYKWGEPPHGSGMPCPVKLRESDAYVAMLEAQKASYVGSGFMVNDAAAMMRKLTGIEEPDDEGG